MNFSGIKYLGGFILFCASFAASSHIFYQVESTDGSHQRAYLFGTMHMLCQEDFAIPNSVLQAFQRAQRLIVEVDLTSTQQQQQLQNQLQQQPADYLQQQLDSKQYESLSENFQARLGVPLTRVESMRPFVLSAMLMQSYLACDAETISLDEYFMSLAQADNKEIIGLETIDQQLSLFEQIPLTAQIAELMELAVDQAAAKQEIQALTNTYLRADSEEIYQLIKSQEDFVSFQSALLDDRNHLWLAQLPKLLEDQETFIAVGAGHLAGSEGLVQLLQSNGFRVTPIPIRLATP